MTQRYTMVQSEETGLWAIVDVFTGLPVVIDGVPIAGLDIQEADDALDLINSMDIKARRDKGIP